MRIDTLAPRIRKGFSSLFPRCASDRCRRGQALFHDMTYRKRGMVLLGKWYCSPECCRSELQQVLEQLHRIPLSDRLVSHRVPLGLMLMAQNRIDRQQLSYALQKQKAEPNDRIGQWLVRLGYIDEAQLLTTLSLQWGCPAFKVDAQQIPACMGLLPMQLLEQYRAVPMHFVHQTKTLHVGLSTGIEHSFLYAIEQMLDCKTKSCVVADSAADRLLRSAGEQTRKNEVVFESPCQDSEISRICIGYMVKLSTLNARVVRCGNHIWFRLTGREQDTDLLFQAA
jgi:hypothetical protein